MLDFKKFDPLERLVLPIIADLFGAARRRGGDYSVVREELGFQLGLD
jgi:hypothetical protein